MLNGGLQEGEIVRVEDAQQRAPTFINQKLEALGSPHRLDALNYNDTYCGLHTLVASAPPPAGAPPALRLVLARGGRGHFLKAFALWPLSDDDARWGRKGGRACVP